MKLNDTRTVHGRYAASILTPRPDALRAFYPLWDRFNRAIEAGDEELKRYLQKLMAPLQFVRFMESFPNLVTTVGKNDILDKYLKGSTYTQTLRMGLCGTGTKAAADTQASHAGWSEVGGTNAPAYTGNRPSITMGSASAGVSTSPSQAYAITSSGTVAGCFMNNGGSATKDDTTGVLFSAGDFSGGSQAVANLDTLNVVYTLTAT